MAELERAIPSSLDTERSILGCILLENEHWLEASQHLSYYDFLLDSHRRIYWAMEDMLKTGKPVDILTLAEELRRRKEIEAAGGVAYLASLTEGLPRRLSIHEYIEIVAEKSRLRQTVEVAERLVASALDQSTPAMDLIAAVDKELLAISAMSANAPSLETQCLGAFEEIERQRSGEAPMFLATGIQGLDMAIGGLPFGELTILAARPGQGKSALIAQLIVRHAWRGTASHVFSIEMTAKQILRRIFAHVSGVSFHKLRHPEIMSQDEHERVRAATLDVASWPLVIDDTSTITAEQIANRARLLKRKHNTQFIAVDYLQKMSFSRRISDRFAEVGDACVRMARLAKDEQVALLLLSSLTEKTGARANDEPTIDDLRASGDIKFEGSNILLLHRVTDRATGEHERDGDIIIGKARNDKTGRVRVHFNTQFLQFEDITAPMYQEDQ